MFPAVKWMWMWNECLYCAAYVASALTSLCGWVGLWYDIIQVWGLGRFSGFVVNPSDQSILLLWNINRPQVCFGVNWLNAIVSRYVHHRKSCPPCIVAKTVAWYPSFIIGPDRAGHHHSCCKQCFGLWITVNIPPSKTVSDVRENALLDRCPGSHLNKVWVWHTYGWKPDSWK